MVLVLVLVVLVVLVLVVLVLVVQLVVLVLFVLNWFWFRLCTCCSAVKLKFDDMPTKYTMLPFLLLYSVLVLYLVVYLAVDHPRRWLLQRCGRVCPNLY